MFVRLPTCGAIVDTSTVRRVYRDGMMSQWAMEINSGSVFDVDLRTLYIDKADYDYLWEQLQKHDMLT